MNLEPGVVIGSRYELIAPIAVGGMGAVWKATDTTLQRPVAIKLLKPELTSDPTFLARFRGEARHSGRLSHPNIAAVFDYGETPGDAGVVQAYLVMELVPGEPLSHVLGERHRLPPEQVLDLVRQVGAGLAAAHKAGIVHRDVKPGNLIITPDGRVKITDFGIARAVDAVPLTATGTVMGTARYLSPEQATGAGLGPASDIYSLGVVAYEALAGRPPFNAESQVAQAMAHVNDPPAPLPAHLPGDVRLLVMTMLAKYPDERPSDGAALVSEVDDLLHGTGTDATATLSVDSDATQVFDGIFDAPTPVGAPPVDSPALTPDPPRRRRLTGPLVVLLLLIVFVALGALFADRLRPQQSPTPATTVTVTESVRPSNPTPRRSVTSPRATERTATTPATEPAPTQPTTQPNEQPTASESAPTAPPTAQSVEGSV